MNAMWVQCRNVVEQRAQIESGADAAIEQEQQIVGARDIESSGHKASLQRLLDRLLAMVGDQVGQVVVGGMKAQGCDKVVARLFDPHCKPIFWFSHR